MSATIHKTEVRVYRSTMSSDCDTTDGLNLKLFTVNDQNEASQIDSVTVHMDHEGWIIFDSATYQPNMHKMAISVTAGSCANVKLTQLGFEINDNDKLPMLVVFTSQERMMTETRLMPASLVDELTMEDADSSNSIHEEKRAVHHRTRCHKVPHTVR